jgi:hypothetical protein
MGVETATYISQLSATNPLGTDPISDGDNQIRLVKDVLQKQFTTLGAAAVTTTAGELNVLDAVTAGTAAASKAVVLDANAAVNAVKTAALHIGTSGSETAVTATGAELNYNDITTLGTVEASKVVTATAAGLVNHADYQVSRPYFLDIGETVNALGDTGGGTDDIDIEAGNVVTATVSTATQTFTFSNPSATGRSCSFLLILTNGGSQTVNWPGAVDWAGGSAPTLTASGLDVLVFTTVDAGTTWLGFLAGADVS